MDNSLSFYFRLLTPDSPPIGRVICAVEKDNTYHVETRFRGGFWSATPESGVRWISSLEHEDDPTYWMVVKVPEEVTGDVGHLIASQIGQKYDFFGAFNSALGIPVRDPYRWFCSELAAEIATSCGIEGLDSMPDPSKLRFQLRQHTGQCETFVLSGPDQIPILGDAEFAYIQDLVATRKIDAALAQKLIAAGGKA